jgi:CDP-paratose 2-epimerase
VKKAFVTGGAGFIGCNMSRRLIEDGWQVVIYDNLSRPGTLSNLHWLKRFGSYKLVKGDLRDAGRLRRSLAASGAPDAVFHFAGQVAVTTSVKHPREDFEINALGTFNLLEAVRSLPSRGTKGRPAVLFSSTNKVYGGMEDIRVVERRGRYQYRDLPKGIPEDRLLDFHSPYGCSKGTADQYVRDYQRIYGIPTVVFRQSCIYGYRQFGVEDQGWVAWFTIAAALGKPLTIYGDGKQVRDVLFIDDLVEAYLGALRNIRKTAGQVYNIGGGHKNQMSLRELLAFLSGLLGRSIPVRYGDWRPGDQPVFVCDIAKARREFGWTPKVGVEEGVKKLYAWVMENKALFA